MASKPKRSGGSFGNFGGKSFGKVAEIKPYKVEPITAEFGGSIPNSLYTIDRNSSWSRWRRGYELATSNLALSEFSYPFVYEIPTAEASGTVGNREPFISGAFLGFPTSNKELGMHWAGRVFAGNLRFDRLDDNPSGPGTPLAISGEVPKTTLFLGLPQDNENYWYIQLSGTFSFINPVPPPLYVTFPGQPFGIKPINGDVLEDKILTVSGEAINKDTRNPATNIRYGFVQAVLSDVDQFQGILKLDKLGSVQATIDGVLVTPSRIPPHKDRFFQNGDRFCCSCQDFTRRDYAYLSTVGKYKRPLFPRNNVASLKPGRSEEMYYNGDRLNSAMTKANEDIVQNRTMTLVAPSGYQLLGVASSGITKDARDPKTLYRDVPGVYSEFGSAYRRGFGDNPSPTQIAEGMPKYGDYTQSGLDITSITDSWTYVLDQYRYCKHIYALRYLEGEFPTEPSDFPVQVAGMIEWENELIEKTQKEQAKAFESVVYHGVSYMDVPPYNCQAPMMMPMMQRLFNVPTEFIDMNYFIMYDKNNQPYIPVSGEKPGQ
jgi:hypothetical protein